MKAVCPASKLRILLITPHYAPSPAVGGKRFTFLAHEFEKLGRDVHVVTASSTSCPTADNSLPIAAHVYRCTPELHLPEWGPSLSRRAIRRIALGLLQPYRVEWSWVRPAARVGCKIAAGQAAGVIVATSPPFSSVVAGYSIAARTNWPLIVDYRDPYSAYPWYYRGAIGASIANRIERRYVSKAAARVFNTLEMKLWFEDYFPDLSHNSGIVLPNASEGPPKDQCSRSRNRHIVYAGTVYGDRSLIPVLVALKRIIASGGERSDLRVVVYGEVADREVERVRAAGLANLLDIRARIPKDELWNELASARLLLAVSGEQKNYSVPYKVYDYIATQSPFLVLGPSNSAVRRMVEEHRVGVFVDRDDLDSVESALRQLLASGSGPVCGEAHHRFRWPARAKEYLQLIDTVAKNPCRVGYEET